MVDWFVRSTDQTYCKHWFLTHFHADHYKGLTSKFQSGEEASLPKLLHSLCEAKRLAALHAWVSLWAVWTLGEGNATEMDGGSGKEQRMHPFAGTVSLSD